MEECNPNMWDTLLGGLLAILGGWGAIWFQTRNARKNRMDELTAERKVAANAEAYRYAKEIEGMLIQSSTEDTLKRVLSLEEWFFSNRLFLPGVFPAKWLSIRNNLSKLSRWQKSSSKSVEEISALEIETQNSVAEAIDEIYKDMNLSRIEIKQKSV